MNLPRLLRGPAGGIVAASVPARVLSLAASMALAGVLLACAPDPDRCLDTVRSHIAAGDLEAAEDELRRGLDGSPDHVPLLIEAAELYLRAEPESWYRPRLAVHYALRADKAARGLDPAATRTLTRAWRGGGRPPAYEALIEKGLDAVHGPAPRGELERVALASPERLDLTPENLRADRRDRERPADRCADGLTLVPSGVWPIAEGATVAAAAFCVEARAATSVALRPCDSSEVAVSCGPMSRVLGAPAACDQGGIGLRCASPLPVPTSLH